MPAVCAKKVDTRGGPRVPPLSARRVASCLRRPAAAAARRCHRHRRYELETLPSDEPKKRKFSLVLLLLLDDRLVVPRHEGRGLVEHHPARSRGEACEDTPTPRSARGRRALRACGGRDAEGPVYALCGGDSVERGVDRAEPLPPGRLVVAHDLDLADVEHCGAGARAGGGGMGSRGALRAPGEPSARRGAGARCGRARSFTTTTLSVPVVVSTPPTYTSFFSSPRKPPSWITVRRINPCLGPGSSGSNGGSCAGARGWKGLEGLFEAWEAHGGVGCVGAGGGRARGRARAPRWRARLRGEDELGCDGHPFLEAPGDLDLLPAGRTEPRLFRIRRMTTPVCARATPAAPSRRGKQSNGRPGPPSIGPRTSRACGCPAASSRPSTPPTAAP